MNELLSLSIEQALSALNSKAISARDLAEAHIAQMEEKRDLNLFISETPEIALHMADASDARRAKGESGQLDGIPFAVKDNYCTSGVLTTAGSHILDGFVPPYESTVTAKLWQAGAVMLGKANMDEFAMGSSTESGYYGATSNPIKGTGTGADKTRVPGGSSGGSAAAVAAHAAIAALGTDTGGSIRQPASFCGVVGVKPTYGRCSRWGIVAYGSSLDQAGPITRTVKDAALVLNAICGHDPKDSTSAAVPVPNFASGVGEDVKGMKIGVPREYRTEDTPADVAAIWDSGVTALQREGAEVVEVSLPNTHYALPCYYIIAMAEASSNLARYDGVRYGLRVPGESFDDMIVNTRSAGFGAEVKRRILLGTYVLSAGYYDAYYLKAQKVRTLINRDFQTAFESVDALLVPTAPSSAFHEGEFSSDPVSMYLQDIFTVPVNLAGLPAISIPFGTTTDGFPLGLQVIGRKFDEATVLQVAERVVRAGVGLPSM